MGTRRLEMLEVQEDIVLVRPATAPFAHLDRHCAADDVARGEVLGVRRITLHKPFAGAIIAALFLKRFVSKQVSWAHIDAYAWNDGARPGRPEGGEAQTLRAVLGAVENLAKTQ